MKFLLLPLLSLLLIPSFLFAQSSADAGSTLGNQALGSYGSKEGLNSNLFQPMMSGASPMQTLDGSKQFNAQLSCPSSQRFLEIFLQPGPTGDITTLMVSEDIDWDGALDYVYQAPFAVSGICANGVIACDPGAWANCAPYVWTSSSDGKASLQPALDSDMKSCFCVNGSCGANLVFRNLNVILNAMGGGVVAAIHRSNARYVISDVQIDGTYARYFGQDSSKCSSAVASSTPEQYSSNPFTLQGAVNAEVASQSGDPASYYTMLTNAANAIQNPMSLRPCTITNVSLTTVDLAGACQVLDSTIDTCQAIAQDPNCEPSPRDETVDGVTTIQNYVVTGLYPTPSCQSSTTTVEASCSYVCPGAGNWSVPCLDTPVCVVGTEMAVCSNGSCPLDGSIPCSSAPTCNAQGQAQLCQVQNPILEAVGGWNFGIGVAATGNVLHFYTGGVETGHVTFAPGVIATASFQGVNYLLGWAFCGGNAFGIDRSGWGTNLTFTVTGLTLTGCTSGAGGGLFQGSLATNGTSLYISGVGLNTPDGVHWGTGNDRFDFSADHCPLPNATPCGGIPASCYETCQNTACKDWWVKQRTYACRTGTYDFTDAKKRVETIRSSVQDEQTAFYYRDYRKTDQGWQYEDNTYDITGTYRPTVAACEKACKTKKLVDDTQTTITANKDDFVAPTTYQFFYKACTDAGCPLQPSEQIVTDCQCINEFAEAALIMQSLRQAGKDLICSSGQKGMPP